MLDPTKPSAEIVQDSISPSGHRVVTMSVNIHRFVLAELSKHRQFSLSAQSSRAVPVKKMLETLETNPALPVFWGKNQPGMTAKEENFKLIVTSDGDCGNDYYTRDGFWRRSADQAIEAARYYDSAGYHKQIVNRLLEPFMWQKCLITATEWDNFWNLRLHPDAQPELQVAAKAMKDAFDASTPTELQKGQWHLPYVSEQQLAEFGLENAKRYSAARCAVISYRTESVTLEKGLEIFDKLVVSEPKHEVPLEHVCTPMAGEYTWDRWEFPRGITHVGRGGYLWSGNFKGWMQLRHYGIN